jgi:hypothetical protein
MKLLAIIFLTLSLGSLHAQKISATSDTIRWNCSSLKDLKTNVTIQHQCSFVSYGVQRFKWVQSNGDFVTEWNVLNVVGDWSDTNSLGSITFNISSEQQGAQLTGSVSFTRTSEDFYADLKILGGPTEVNLRYQISSNEKI